MVSLQAASSARTASYDGSRPRTDRARVAQPSSASCSEAPSRAQRPRPRPRTAPSDVRSGGERLPHCLEPVRQPRPHGGRLWPARPGIGSRESTPTCGEDLHGDPLGVVLLTDVTAVMRGP